MYNIVKNVIASGNYDLSAVLGKIDTLWAEGKISDDQRTELKELSRNEANPKESVDLFAKLMELEARIKALEEKKSEGDSTEEVVEDYTVGKWYYNGNKCLWNGETYICTAPNGVVCVWSPDEYPAYWSKVE